MVWISGELSRVSVCTCYFSDCLRPLQVLGRGLYDYILGHFISSNACQVCFFLVLIIIGPVLSFC